MRINDIKVNDLFIPAFEFNSKSPRFYSKYFVNEDPAKYDIPLWEIAASTSSAPGFFDPFQRVNGFNITEYLIDGAIICNDPSFLAW